MIATPGWSSSYTDFRGKSYYPYHDRDWIEIRIDYWTWLGKLFLAFPTIKFPRRLPICRSCKEADFG